MKIKTDSLNYGLVNNVFVFPETYKEYLARLRKVDRKEFLKCKRRDRMDDILNRKKRVALAQWYEIDHCVME